VTRQTSIAAYHEIKDSGLLSRRRWEVYDVLFRKGPLTANEAFVAFAKESGRALLFDSNTRARFTELRDMGVAVELGVRQCSITGMTTILWDVTDRLPVALPKRQSKYAAALARIEELEAEQERLEDALTDIAIAAGAGHPLGNIARAALKLKP